MPFVRQIPVMLYPDGDGITPRRHERNKRLFCAFLMYSRLFPPRNVAALFGVSRTVAYEWAKEALGYDEPEAQELRRLVGRG